MTRSMCLCVGQLVFKKVVCSCLRVSNFSWFRLYNVLDSIEIRLVLLDGKNKLTGLMENFCNHSILASAPLLQSERTLHVNNITIVRQLSFVCCTFIWRPQRNPSRELFLLIYFIRNFTINDFNFVLSLES